MLLTGTSKLALSAKCYVFTRKTLLTGTVFVRKNSLVCEMLRIYGLTGTVSVRKTSLVCTMLYFYGKNAFDRNGFLSGKLVLSAKCYVFTGKVV